MSRTLLDLPAQLFQAVERNAVAWRLAEAHADGWAELDALFRDIHRHLGSERPTLSWSRDEPGSVELDHGLVAEREPDHYEVPIRRWPALAQLKDPLKGLFEDAYDRSTPEGLGRLFHDIHLLVTRHAKLAEEVGAYNEQVRALVGPVDAEDLASHRRDPSQETAQRIMFGAGGLYAVVLELVDAVHEGQGAPITVEGSRARQVFAPGSVSAETKKQWMHLRRWWRLRREAEDEEHGLLEYFGFVPAELEVSYEQPDDIVVRARFRRSRPETEGSA